MMSGTIRSLSTWIDRAVLAQRLKLFIEPAMLGLQQLEDLPRIIIIHRRDHTRNAPSGHRPALDGMGRSGGEAIAKGRDKSFNS